MKKRYGQGGPNDLDENDEKTWRTGGTEWLWLKWWKNVTDRGHRMTLIKMMKKRDGQGAQNDLGKNYKKNVTDTGH